jgi:C1A family cysteine protease
MAALRLRWGGTLLRVNEEADTLSRSSKTLKILITKEKDKMKLLACILLLLLPFWELICVDARMQPKRNSIGLHAQPTAPRWPDSYSVTYVFSLPYTAEVQPDAVNYTVVFHRDNENKNAPRVRMDTLDGTNVLIAGNDVEYELVPRLDVQVCRVNKDIEPGEGSSSTTALPDISEWDFQGNGGFVNGQQTALWQYQQHHASKTVQYNFYVTQKEDGQQHPVRLHMIGNDIFSGAHYDEWVADYVSFTPGKPDPAVFEKPSICDDEEKTVVRKGPSTAGLRLMHITPTVHYRGEHAEYDAFVATGHGRGRVHANLQEYRHRASLFQKNTAMIAQHNAANKTFTMAMNKFGDWTREEYLAVMLPRKHRKITASGANGGTSTTKNGEKISSLGADGKLGKHEIPYSALSDISKIPTSIDWRGTGADTGVKDQANCGSCWAFGAVGAMESAWFHATGQSVKLSEQQVMDCAWGFVPGKEESASACDGGDAWAGIGHVVDAGGIAKATEYQYLGQDDYCRENSQSLSGGGKFKGYARVPQYNDTALMEAVYSRGPVAVSLDASQDSFTFYSSGVYYDTNCMWKPEDLDHSQLLVGYGTEEAGDYWIVKNSWSRHWGDNGYVKIARDNHGCGASTDAVYAVVDDEDRQDRVYT